jgi:colicin import membrane protein
LNGFYYDDWNTFLEQRSSQRNWKWSLNLAIAFHLAVFAGAIILPDFLDNRPVLDNVVSVDLVSMPEPAAPPPPAATQTAPAPEPVSPPLVKVPEPVVVPEIVEIPVTPEPEVAPEPAAPAEPVSLQPVKRKKRIASDTRLKSEKKKEQQAKLRKQQQIAAKQAEQARTKKAAANAKRAQQEADREAARAREELAAMLRMDSAVQQSATSSSPGAAGRKSGNSAIKNQYYASLNSRISSYWKLPEMVKRNQRLTTKVALTIRRDGSIASLQIERKSGDDFFDQSVLKALRSAAPLPSFPAMITEPFLDFALNFTPQGLM